MRLQTNPNGWSCLPTSFAMALDISVELMVGLIGHDGSDRPYESKNFRAGFHEQECIRVADSLGFTCTPFELVPTISPFPDGAEARPILYGPDVSANFIEFYTRTLGRQGVICGCNLLGVGHAVAWTGTRILDPRDKTYQLRDTDMNDFLPRSFWDIRKLDE